jgi:hypothetical protein
METCPNCNMPQSGWKANGGQGYEKNGQRYCCRNCADGATCTCR